MGVQWLHNLVCRAWKWISEGEMCIYLSLCRLFNGSGCLNANCRAGCECSISQTSFFFFLSDSSGFVWSFSPVKNFDLTKFKQKRRLWLLFLALNLSRESWACLKYLEALQCFPFFWGFHCGASGIQLQTVWHSPTCKDAKGRFDPQ